MKHYTIITKTWGQLSALAIDVEHAFVYLVGAKNWEGKPFNGGTVLVPVHDIQLIVPPNSKDD